MAISSINPADGRLLRTFKQLEGAALEAALDKGIEAFTRWRTRPMEERVQVVRRAAGLLTGGKETWGELMTLEMGKPVSQGEAEAAKCAWVCEYYAEQAGAMLARRVVATDARSSYVRYDPLGVILGIMPWNFPFWQVFRFAVPTLLAGNAVMLKHASNVPQCAQAIEGIWREAGLPPGLFQTLLVDAAAAEALVSDPRVAGVSLTGSEAAGRRVAAAAGRSLKKAVFELGGSDPFIVLEDADLEAAARVGTASRCINSGQSCIAAKRFLVVESVADDFLEAFQAELAAVPAGDPMDRNVQVGPLAREDIRSDLQRQVEESLAAGARLRLGGAVPPGKGFFYPVTLLDRVTADMAASREETFGPVAAVLRVKDERAAITLANQSPYGLGASIWTRDLEKGHALAGRVESGAVFVNGLVKSDPRLPFGGIKASGFGRELGSEGIREFVNIKSVWVGGE